MPFETARDAMRSGDLLGACDAAMAAIAAGSEDRRLRFLLVLALARMGETDRAHGLFEAYGLGADGSEDVLALQGRLLKDRAIAATGAERGPLFAVASRAYLAAHERFGGYFALINAASLSRLAGDTAAAGALARRVLDDPAVARPESYFAAASAAEAWLLLDEHERALAAVEAALGFGDADLGARASTVRQFALLGADAGVPADRIEVLCARLRPPPVVFYAGHMFAADAGAEAAIAARIDAVLAASGTAVAYGALACGADILCAEAVLRRGAELHVVLPFATADFVAESVLPGGAEWLPRFEAALAAARSVTFASEAEYVGDPEQFRYGSSLAMGMALLRGAHLQTGAEQIAIWDGAPQRGPGGTAGDVALWRGLGHDVHVIDPGDIVRPAIAAGSVAGSLAARASPVAAGATRCQRAILFTDYSGFSRLGEAALPGFWAEVMGHVAGVLATAGDAIGFRNSWGDAIFAVIDDIAVAARVALDIVADPLAAAGETGMRVGLHFGPVYRMIDPITGVDGYIGTEVTRAARIEPVTPIGQVYVTQPFAAMLALAGSTQFRLEYVGKVVLAKGYGVMPLYRLSR